ncbi:MAG: PhoPQ-activated pathogenicity-related family protein [Armatimonadetes bacterium]|nr:PhoPQ-activated pathogenicity-related family protein [Armatimonadota bacterium]
MTKAVAYVFGCILTPLVVSSLGLAQPLFDYVNAPDPAYKWEIVSETAGGLGCKLITLKLTSQVWQGITWTHQLVMVQPPKLDNCQTAVMLISGGKMGDKELAMLSLLAANVGGPIIYLGDIPNQPLFDNLREDALIAYTFTRALETKDMSWPLLFPMVKSAVRAMDAIQDYTQQHWPQRIEKFVTTGASKRGWTTWFSGEVDPRVVGIAPIVYNNLDLARQMALQKSSYGVYSSQIDDYTALGLPDLLQTPAGKEFGATVDPYTYRDKLTMPKLLIHGTNDPYWVVDSANIYWDDLPGPKYLLNMPNVGHGVDPVRFLPAEAAFYLACAGRVQLPQLNWHFQRDPGVLKLGIVTDMAPKRVARWTATAPTRDFRPAKWECTPVEMAAGQWVTELARPATGYAAMFAEIVYDLGGREVPLSTTIEIIGGAGQ